MKRYEFIILSSPTTSPYVGRLNEMGQNGWSVVSAAWFTAGGLQSVLFQREIVETLGEPAGEREKRK